MNIKEWVAWMRVRAMTHEEVVAEIKRLDPELYKYREQVMRWADEN
jgi:hypothetical protein